MEIAEDSPRVKLMLTCGQHENQAILTKSASPCVSLTRLMGLSRWAAGLKIRAEGSKFAAHMSLEIPIAVQCLLQWSARQYFCVPRP